MKSNYKLRYYDFTFTKSRLVEDLNDFLGALGYEVFEQEYYFGVKDKRGGIDDSKTNRTVDKSPKTKDLIREFIENYNGPNKLKMIDISRGISKDGSAVRHQFKRDPQIKALLDEVNYKIELNKINNRYKK